MGNLLQHIKKQRPILDTENKFIFLSNGKTAQISIRLSMIDRVLRHNAAGKRKPIRIQYWETLKRYSIQDINSIFKFTFVRNPWDRTVSTFHYIKQKYQKKPRSRLIDRDENFKNFVKNRFAVDGIKLSKFFHHQHPKAYYENNLYVDYIGRFENLKDDWKHVANIINADNHLSHANTSEHKNYKTYYDDECIRIVAKIYKKDIKLFNYSF